MLTDEIDIPLMVPYLLLHHSPRTCGRNSLHNTLSFERGDMSNLIPVVDFSVISIASFGLGAEDDRSNLKRRSIDDKTIFCSIMAKRCPLD